MYSFCALCIAAASIYSCRGGILASFSSPKDYRRLLKTMYIYTYISSTKILNYLIIRFLYSLLFFMQRLIFRSTIIIHPLNDTRTPPNRYTYVPYLNKFKSSHFKLEHHVCLTCLHPNRENQSVKIQPARSS